MSKSYRHIRRMYRHMSTKEKDWANYDALIPLLNPLLRAALREANIQTLILEAGAHGEIKFSLRISMTFTCAKKASCTNLAHMALADVSHMFFGRVFADIWRAWPWCMLCMHSCTLSVRVCITVYCSAVDCFLCFSVR